MENNEYYTPTIEEFHVGFEFEYKPKIGPWVKINYNNWMSPSKGMDLDFCTEQDLLRKFDIIDQCIKKNNVRCKFLNQSDIESLGWEFEKQHPGLEEICFSIGKSKHYDILYMDYDLESKYMRISWLGEGDVTRFSGIIKNKSELKKLMQQLNIK